MNDFRETDPEISARIRESFAQQALLQTLGARISSVEPGRVGIVLPFDKKLTQQDGFLHAGAVTTILDSACGYAALTKSAPGLRVLTIEFKTNFLSPAVGESFEAVGTVVRAGRTITVAEAKAHALRGGKQVLVATMQATLILVGERS